MIQVNEVITPDKDALFNLYSKILESGKITNNGQYVRQLEHELQDFLHTKSCLSVANGTLALHLAIRALSQTGEIITTPFSCVASSSSIIWEGCTPVFCDIDPNTFCIDPKKIEEKITPKTIAILGVHVYGTACDVKAIESIAKKHGIKVIYDGAHAFGTKYKGGSLFNFGDISTLSLHAYKIVSSIEGGAIFSKDEAINERLYKMRYFGKNKENLEEILGTNAKMNEFNAAYGILSLQNASNELHRRKAIAHLYLQELQDVSGLAFQVHQDDVEANYSYFPVICPTEQSAKSLTEKALAKNIVLRRYFYPAINSIDYIGANDSETPISASYANRVLCLPIHSKLSDDEVLTVISIVRETFHAHNI